MPGSDPSSPAQLSGVSVREVDWQHEAAVALRKVLASETQLRYGDQLSSRGAAAVACSIDVSALAYTGVAFAADGLPIGHAALCWNSDDLELRAMCVTPFCQPAATGAALLAAAENAARRLGAKRVIVFARDRDPVSWYRQAQYELIPRPAPHGFIRFSQCYGKVIASTKAQGAVTVVERPGRAARVTPKLQFSRDEAGGSVDAASLPPD
jgi:GNAT superfamily N-acetyltransferase